MDNWIIIFLIFAGIVLLGVVMYRTSIFKDDRDILEWDKNRKKLPEMPPKQEFSNGSFFNIKLHDIDVDVVCNTGRTFKLLRVSRNSKFMEVDEELLKLPKHQKYYLLKWGEERRNLPSGLKYDIQADEVAIKAYLEKGYNRKELSEFVSKLFMNNRTESYIKERFQAFVDYLYKNKPHVG
jgi:hypothetical protein